MKVLFVGCGDIACRVPPKLPQTDQCFGVRRSYSEQIPGIDMLQGDIVNEQWLESVINQQFDVVIVTLTPDEFTEDAYRKAYLQGAQSLVKAINGSAHKPQLVIWVSSSSVYGHGSGDWVDENSPTEPTTFSGKILLQAEQEVQRASCKTVVVRFSGIYGPGRNRLLTAIRRGEVCAEQPPCWSNRIHSEDCAGVIAHLIKLYREKESLYPLYLASDCEPVLLHEVHHWLTTQLNVQVTTTKPATRANRRCSNQRLLNSGYRFIYPTYKEGYEAILVT